MELEGLKRCQADLKDSGVVVEELTTDRHTQIDKYVKDNRDIRHTFDIWHIAKSELLYSR